MVVQALKRNVLQSLMDDLRSVWLGGLDNMNRPETLHRLAQLIERVRSASASKTVDAAVFGDLMAQLTALLTSDGVFGQPKSLMDADPLPRSPWLFEQCVGVLQTRLIEQGRSDGEQRSVLLDGSKIPDASVLLPVTCLALLLAIVRHGTRDVPSRQQISLSTIHQLKQFQHELSRLAALHTAARSIARRTCEVFAACCTDLAEALDDLLPVVEREQLRYRVVTLHAGDVHRAAVQKMAEQMPKVTHPDSWFKQISTSVRRYHENRKWHWPANDSTTVKAEEKATYEESRTHQMHEQRGAAISAIDVCSVLLSVLRPQLFVSSVTSTATEEPSRAMRHLAALDKAAFDAVVLASEQNRTPCDDELLRHVLLHCGPMVSATGDGPLLPAVRRLFAAGHDAVYALNMVQLLGLGYITQTYRIDQASKRCVVSIGYRCFGEEHTSTITVFRVTLDYTPPPYMAGDEAVWAWWLTSDVPASETPVRHGNRQKQLDDWGHAACNGGMSGHKGGEYSGTATEHFLPVDSTTRAGALDASFPLPPSDPSVAVDIDGVATLTKHHTKALAAFRKRCATAMARAVSLSGEPGDLQNVLRSFEAASREVFLVATFAFGPDRVPNRMQALNLALGDVQRLYAESEAATVAAGVNPTTKIRQVGTSALESLPAALDAVCGARADDAQADTGFAHLQQLQQHVATFLALYEPRASSGDSGVLKVVLAVAGSAAKDAAAATAQSRVAAAAGAVLQGT